MIQTVLAITFAIIWGFIVLTLFFDQFVEVRRRRSGQIPGPRGAHFAKNKKKKSGPHSRRAVPQPEQGSACEA